jgi:hypothetical protein
MTHGGKHHMSERHNASERGAAIIIVLLLGLIGIALVTAMMTFANTSTPLARNDQDWNGSLSAAEAGIDDYLYRLSKDSSYWQKATDPTNPALVATGTGAQVPGGSTESTFRYTRTPPTVTLNGTIKLKVTGMVRGSKRTLEATLRRDGFLDYLYFSKYETVDPDSYSTTGTPSKAWADANCKDRYYYAVGNPGDPGYIPPRVTSGSPACNEIRWVTGDTLNGPLHTNDALRIDGNPIFTKKVTTSWAKVVNAGSPFRWVQHDSTPSNPQFNGTENQAFPNPPASYEKDNPIIASRLDPPADNSELLQDAQAEGCVYTGPTWIKLKSTSAGVPTWDVVSPGTTFTPDCGGGSSTAQTNIDGPANFNGVIYVQNSLATCSYAAHPNSGAPYPPGLPVPIKETSGSLTLARAADITTYGCTSGDAFVEGTLNGQLTIGAQNNIAVVKDIKYADITSASDDVLGLITNNYIELLHPVRCTNCPVSGSTAKTYANISGYWDSADPWIYAAMLSTKHSFRVQQWDKGAQPGSSSHLLHIVGAIAQIYRGPVGTSAPTGYYKDYTYDNRLKLISPPSFLDPVQSAWKVKTWAEVKPN